MERAERTGFAIAAAGHVVLFGALSLGLFTKPSPKPPLNDPMDVQFVDAVGLRSAAPAASEAPAVSEAPELGRPEEPPPETAPAPEPTPAPDAAPTPAPAKAPSPKPTPAKPTSEKAAPAKSRLSPDLLKGLRDPAEPKKAAGSRLGPDFLKGIAATDKAGKGAAPRAATVDARAMAGLAAAIAAQVKPCYVVPAGGTDSGTIVTVLRLQFKPDGSVASVPSVVEQSGVTAANQSYSRQMAEAAKRAVLKCAPLRLPPDLYRGGWEDIEFVFNPRQMG